MNYNEAEKYIVSRFNSRTNAVSTIDFESVEGKKILRGIVETYLMYKKKYPSEIDVSKIGGSERITKHLKKEMPRDLAELYLDRLLLNFHELFIDKNNKEKIKGACLNNTIIINPSRIETQIDYWGETPDLSDYEKSSLKGHINQKVYDHELAHMSARRDAIGNCGFVEGDKQTKSSRLEEIMAEKTALDVTGCKIPKKTEYKFESGEDIIEMGGYNPESSNYNISSFIELIPFAIGDRRIVEGRLLNAEQFMTELNDENSKYARKGETFAQTFESDCQAITGRDDLVKLIEWQNKFMHMGYMRLSRESYKSTVTEQEFCQDLDCMLRTYDLLVKHYQKGILQETNNVVAYKKVMEKMESLFKDLQKNQGFFKGIKDFSTLKDMRTNEIKNTRELVLNGNKFSAQKPANIGNSQNLSTKQSANRLNFATTLVDKYKQIESDENYQKRVANEERIAQKIINVLNRGKFEKFPNDPHEFIRMLITAQNISIEGGRNFFAELIDMPEVNKALLDIKNNERLKTLIDDTIEQKKQKGEKLYHKETELETSLRLANSSSKNHPEEFKEIVDKVSNNDVIDFEDSNEGQRKHKITKLVALTQGKLDMYREMKKQMQ